MVGRQSTSNIQLRQQTNYWGLRWFRLDPQKYTLGFSGLTAHQAPEITNSLVSSLPTRGSVDSDTEIGPSADNLDGLSAVDWKRRRELKRLAHRRNGRDSERISNDRPERAFLAGAAREAEIMKPAGRS